MLLLPPPASRYSTLQTATTYLKTLLASKRVKYRIAAVLDLLLIIIILVNGRQSAGRLISPFVSSITNAYSIAQHKNTPESFAFAPGLARNKFSDIDLEGLNTLSFFDVPLTEEGEINFDSRGYASFTSGETQELFDRARYQKTKIFLTLSAWEEDVIRNILNNANAQEKLASQIIEEIRLNNINGVTIDFEYPHANTTYQKSFTDFIGLLTNKIHSEIPGAQLAVAVPSENSKDNSLYNIEALSKNSDRIFVIASNIIVPEVKNSISINPTYGYSENDYWNSLSILLNSLLKNIPSEKLVMERAWYGNGDNYPLYVPNRQPPSESEKNPSSVFLDQETLERLVSGVPAKGRDAARRNIPLIAKALDNEGILDSNVLAYALATIEHETDETFEPLEEIGGRVSARRLGYEGGENYFGRGFIQLTHLRNYRIIGERIGMGEELVKHPELAGTPEISAKILAAFFKDNNVANLASQGRFVAARTPVNPDYNGWSVARMAMKYETD